MHTTLNPVLALVRSDRWVCHRDAADPVCSHALVHQRLCLGMVQSKPDPDAPLDTDSARAADATLVFRTVSLPFGVGTSAAGHAPQILAAAAASACYPSRTRWARDTSQDRSASSNPSC